MNFIKKIALLFLVIVAPFYITSAEQCNYNQKSQEFDLLGYKYVVKEALSKKGLVVDVRAKRGMIAEYLVLKDIPLNVLETKKYFQVTLFENTRGADSEISMYKAESKELPIINFGRFNIIYSDDDILKVITGCDDLNFIKILEAQNNIISSKRISVERLLTLKKVEQESTSTNQPVKELNASIKNIISLIDDKQYKLVIDNHIDISTFGFDSSNDVPSEMLKVLRFYLFVLLDKKINPNIQANGKVASFKNPLLGKPIKFILQDNKWRLIKK